MKSLFKKPGAWVPLALSLAMLAFIIVYIAMFGVSAPNPDADEGTPAHIFQLWLVLEFFMVAFFAASWLPQEPKAALLVLALQIFLVLIPMAIVYYLEH